MAQFLKPRYLISELKKLFSEAEQILIIVSPYIKLHPDIKAILQKKVYDDNFEVIVVFGKNEDDLPKSLSQNDFEFFKQFQNVEIRYIENLHAKYYANESKSIITSLNLHSFSIDENIEVGVLFEQKRGARVLNVISEKLAQDSNADYEAFTFFEKVIEQSTEHYNKKVKFKSSFFGLLQKKVGSIVETDNSASIYTNNSTHHGYCIRTGRKINFDLKHPYFIEGYKSWCNENKKDKDYPEKFCHYSGEESYGETSFNSPVLRKYEAVAKG